MSDADRRALARGLQIMADATHASITRPAAGCSGQFHTDQDILAEEGVDDRSGHRLAARDEDPTPNFTAANIPPPTIRTPQP